MTVELSEYVIDAIANAVVKKMQEPCEDVISRQAVLDKLNRLIEVERLQGTDEMGYGRERVSAYESMIFEIESEYLYPSITPQPKWIPVNERLPKEYKKVIVSDVFGVYIGQFVDAEENWGGKHFINENGMHSKSVTAWMPLPEPYKAESEEVEK